MGEAPVLLYNVFGHFGNKNFPFGRVQPRSQNKEINMRQLKEATPAGFAFRLLVATGNRGKVRELCELLADVPVELVDLSDFPDLKDIEETESTFRGNAELKASGYARQTGMWTLADDSGLEVDALGGAPGVYSARFAGAESSYETKIAELLSQIQKAKKPDRRARFVCAIALAAPDGKIEYTTEGRCEGAIAERPRGTHGFGYDPVFLPDGFDRTFGELPGDIKQQISHRGRAAREINRYLLDFIEV